MEIEKCQSCNRPFKVWEHKLAMPGTKEKESITCPYEDCGYIIYRTSNGLWMTAKLTDEQQREY